MISHSKSLVRLNPAAASSFSYEQICDFVDIGNFSVHQPAMSDSIEEPFFKGSTERNTRGVLRLTILCLIAAAAIASRLFSVIRKCASYPDRILELACKKFRFPCLKAFYAFKMPLEILLTCALYRVRKYHPRMSVTTSSNHNPYSCAEIPHIRRTFQLIDM